MDTGATGNRRYGRIGTTPAVGRIAGGRATEIAPTEAVAPPGTATQSDSRSPSPHDDERDPPAGERFALAAETRQVLLSAADERRDRQAWLLPGGALAQLYGNAPAPETSEAEPAEDEPPSPPRPVSRTV